MKFKSPVKLDSFKKQNRSDGFIFEIGKQGEKLDKQELSTEMKMSSYFLKNDKGSTESLKPHIYDQGDFNTSMKNVSGKSFTIGGKTPI